MTGLALVSPSLVLGGAGGAVPAGFVGEFISSNVAGPGSALTTGVVADITSINVTAGRWLVFGLAGFQVAAATSLNQIRAWVNDNSVTTPTTPNGGAYFNSNYDALVLGGGSTYDFPVGMKIYTATENKTLYLSCRGTFTADTMSAYGFIGALRIAST